MYVDFYPDSRKLLDPRLGHLCFNQCLVDLQPFNICIGVEWAISSGIMPKTPLLPAVKEWYIYTILTKFHPRPKKTPFLV